MSVNIVRKKNGFTIVELLIVIVVIAILAAISIVAYNGVTARAQESKMKSDINQIHKAILAARINTGKTMQGVTGAYASVQSCGDKANGSDLAALPQSDACWVSYNAALDKISVASGHNIRGMKDAWGRPYLVYEAEGGTPSQPCRKDEIGVFANPLSSWTQIGKYHLDIALYSPQTSC